MSPRQIDHAQLRDHIRLMERDALLVFVERALEVLPSDALERVFDGYLHLSTFETDNQPPSLLEQIRCFSAAALAGRYYEAFAVTSQNFTAFSGGTQNFLAEFDRLERRLLLESFALPPALAREAFELLLAPLRRIDEGMDDVLFFAEEAGSWQVPVSWGHVLPAYFAVLAGTATPADFATSVDRVIEEFAPHSREKWFAVARRCATRDQGNAFDATPKRARS